MQLLSKFNKRSLLFKILAIFLFSILLLNNIVYIIQPFTSNSIYQYYTNGYFSFVSSTQRIIFGIVPISIGDILYILLVGYLGIQVYSFIIYLISTKYHKLVNPLIKVISTLIVIWLLLGSQWNWNYSQPSLEVKLELDTTKYELDELVSFTNKLLAETIRNKEDSSFDDFNKNPNSILELSHLGYKELAKENSFYKYDNASVKYSLFSAILPYFGIAGYYNPFTSEAQVAKGMPIVLIPYVANHEIAHQLGIASEAEANFIGYIASINNPLSTVKYSGNLRLLMYCLSELRYREYENYDVIKKNISPEVKKDINDIYSYWYAHQNILNKYQSIIYDKFLKSNNQKDGLKSYNKVVSLAIFYNRKT